MRSDGWTSRSLYSLAAYINGRATKPAELVEDGVPVIKIAELNRGVNEQTNRVPREAVQDRHWVREGDLLFAWSGSVGIHVYRGEEAALNQHIFRVDSVEDVDQRFLRYLLEAQTPTFERFVEGKRTTMGHVTVADLKETPIMMPGITEQRRIARVLAALDDKIENNRRLAATLEEIAATLFRARFVDFVGHDDLVESEIGMIPKGWSVKPIGDTVKTVGGATPSTKVGEYWDGGTNPWATPKDLSGLDEPVLLNTARHITDTGMAKISSRRLPKRTVLLSSRAPVGYTAIAMIELSINQGFIAIPPNGSIPSEYVLFWLRQNMEQIAAHAGGTTFAEISKRAFRPLQMLIPDETSLSEFEQISAPLIDRIAIAVRESESLIRLRDALLPRLISGELRVPEDAFDKAEAA